MPFEITYGNTTIRIQPVDMDNWLAFHIVFSSERNPILVVRAMDFNSGEFWTSIPEERQKEPEGVGRLIEDYINFHERKDD